MQLYEQLKTECTAAGFPLFGALDLNSVDLTPHHERYKKWMDQGHAGEMQYLVRGTERRGDPHLVFPEARSIVAVGSPYSAHRIGTQDPKEGIQYARYLRGENYHTRIQTLLQGALEKVTSTHPELKWKICVDTSALMERTWGALAGLGWIGKNMMLIHPQYGSYFLLGFALLNQEVERGSTPLKDYCGSCSRCLTACPTQAFTEERNLDSRKCISYWTLEKRGPLELSSSQVKAMGNWAAGCDICQEVCPFNQKSEKLAAKCPMTSDPELPWRWNELQNESLESYKKRTAHSALERVKPADFMRNLSLIRPKTLQEFDK